MKNLREKYEKLENEIEKRFVALIEKSKKVSHSYGGIKAIYFKLYGYEAMIIYNGKLTLLDYDDYQYDLSNLSMDDQIELLDELKA